MRHTRTLGQLIKEQMSNMETEPMTTTTVTQTTKTERTAEDIIKDLNDGNYTTKGGTYILRNDYHGIAIFRNPAQNNRYSDGDITLTAAVLEEVTYVKDLLEAHRDKRDASWALEDATYALNKEAK